METQNKQIREFLESGNKITPLDALHRFGCFRLSARIYDLRQQGMIIGSETIRVISSGKKKHVTRYYIRKKRK